MELQDNIRDGTKNGEKRKQQKILEIQKILQENHGFDSEQLHFFDNIENFENIKTSKLNLFKAMLNCQPVADKCLSKLSNQSNQYKAFENFFTGEYRSYLKEMLSLDVTKRGFFLRCFEDDCFTYLPENVDLSQLVTMVDKICEDNGKKSVSEVVELLKQKIKTGKIDAFERSRTLSTEDSQTLLDKMQDWTNYSGVNTDKYQGLFQYRESIDYLQTVLKGKKYTNKDLDILLTFTSQQRNFIRTLGKTDNYNALNDFLQAPGKGLQISVETIANLDMKDFAKSLGITEGTNLLETCFEYDMYAVLKQSQKPIEYAELVQYINEFATTYPQHISHPIFFKHWFKGKLSKN